MPRAGKTDITQYDWGAILTDWVLQLFKLLYVSSAMAIIWLFLSLTPVLWAPNNWFAWFIGLVMSTGTGVGYIPNDFVDDIGKLDRPGRCMSWADKRDATAGPADGVSGWYGPGAYLSWLVTAYAAAFPSIWHSKCAQSEEARRQDGSDNDESDNEGEPFHLPKWGSKDPADVLDGEMIAAVAYPLVAVCDVVARLIRCRIDPGMSAAVFVLVSALTVFGPTSRLSWQRDGQDNEEHPEFLPRTNRSWMWKSAGTFIHGVVMSLSGEPYAYPLLVLSVYVMLFLLMSYSVISMERLSETYPYRVKVYPSRAARVTAFTILQISFYGAAYGTIGSMLPVTGSSLWELDQIGALCTTVLTLLYLRREDAKYLVLDIGRQLAGFRRLGGSDPEGGNMELQEMVAEEVVAEGLAEFMA
ncbi:hypothetical protein MFIFM68171_08689 [Madurella fahalii]|uniref:Uncharacterized protein n=1 Tax=Madurella fahalii TaxID=1157608 RepID=A0ABQ0GL95_9PEZI